MERRIRDGAGISERFLFLENEMETKHDEMNSKYNQPLYDGEEGGRKRDGFEEGEKRENQ